MSEIYLIAPIHYTNDFMEAVDPIKPVDSIDYMIDQVDSNDYLIDLVDPMIMIVPIFL